MKSTMYVVGVLLLLTSCSGVKQTQRKEAPSEPMALGWVQRSDFMTASYPSYPEGYDSSRIDQAVVEMIRQLQDDSEVVVVFGTWCSDSKRHVPRFLKLADLAGFPPSRIRFYGVDRTKKSHDGVTDRYGIELVPTFIFLKNGKEIGRIVETPRTSLEEDVLAILAGAQPK